MQAQMQSASVPSAPGRSRATALAWLFGLTIAIHAIWFNGLIFVDSDEIGPAQWAVTSTSLGLNLVALGAMWAGQSWGRWMKIVVTAINIFLVIPEVLFLEGIMRAGSIVAMTLLIASMVLLFRPEIRNHA